MRKASLVIMAAGIGSRFGGGIKQLEPVGPNGEIIMDYSILDALEAGFDKVVFVIRKDISEDFKRIIGKRIEEKAHVEYVYQEVDGIPDEYKEKFKDRIKPWGTGQAILCCKDVVHEPFLVINADDYYGKAAYKLAYDYLILPRNNNGKLSICMVGFVLKNTLSDNGGVTRGVCKVNHKNMLTQIVETQNIVKIEDGVRVEKDGAMIPIDVESVVSMNMWGLVPDMFSVLDAEFRNFLEFTEKEDLKKEYLLPTIIGELLLQNKIEVNVLQSKDKWFGVTYKEDKETVVKEINTLLNKGFY